MPFSEKTLLSTSYGQIECGYFKSLDVGNCLVLYKKPWGIQPFIRIQSSCIFSESFLANDCDCSLQLSSSIKYICAEGGIIIYLWQEGRGIGLEGKMRAMNLEIERGLDTSEAFKILGYKADLRRYSIVIEVLKELDVPTSIVLATNNPDKIKQLEENGFTVIKRHQLRYDTNKKIDKYLNMKKNVLDHYEKN